MTWMFIISTTVWVNGWDTSSVASRARSELTSSKCNWKGNQKGKGTDETPLYLVLIFGHHHPLQSDFLTFHTTIGIRN